MGSLKWIIAGLALIVVSVWFWRGTNEGTVAPEAASTASDVVQESAHQNREVMGGAVKHFNEIDEQQSATVSGTQTEGRGRISEGTPGDRTIDSAAEASMISSDQAEAVEPEESASTTFQVPDSYPIEEAEKYFIPADQRYPGHIGGPPPFKFPTLSSGSAGDNSRGLAPPPAPQ